jgi:hypothetical protein
VSASRWGRTGGVLAGGGVETHTALRGEKRSVGVGDLKRVGGGLQLLERGAARAGLLCVARVLGRQRRVELCTPPPESQGERVRESPRGLSQRQALSLRSPLRPAAAPPHGARAARGALRARGLTSIALVEHSLLGLGAVGQRSELRGAFEGAVLQQVSQARHTQGLICRAHVRVRVEAHLPSGFLIATIAWLPRTVQERLGLRVSTHERRGMTLKHHETHAIVESERAARVLHPPDTRRFGYVGGLRRGEGWQQTTGAQPQLDYLAARQRHGAGSLCGREHREHRPSACHHVFGQTSVP